MTDHTTCPDSALLSQFLDHELGVEDEASIKQHISNCPTCQTKLERTSQAEKHAWSAYQRAAFRLPLKSPSQECLSPEIVAAYVQRALAAEDQKSIEKHLHACDACLSEIMEAFRIVSSLTTTLKESVPAALKAQVASLWESPQEKEQIGSFSRLVIQLAQQSLKLVAQRVVAPLTNIEEMLVPVPAYRTENAPSILNLRIKTGQAEIRAFAAQEGKSIALKLTFLSSEQNALAGHRVFLRQHGQSIFSARTDVEGALLLPSLEPGTYEVSCPGIQTTFQLELCP